MGERLSSIAPDLVAVLASSSPRQLEAVSRRAAEWAASTVGLDDPRASAALRTLAAGMTGPSPERSALESYVEELDTRAWGVREKVDQGQADEADYLALFSQARAASAICFALDGDPRAGASEGVYEAYAATGALEALREIVKRARMEQ